MGRTIRRVPPHWTHPVFTEGPRRGEFIPLFDESYSEAAKEWKEELSQWEAKTHRSYDSDYQEYWDYAGNPPDRDFYLPDGLPDKTWYQVYETVSEGTPVTPPFETQEELVEYLIQHGTFWDSQPWNYQVAYNFVFNSEFMPSGLFVRGQLIDQTQQVI